MFEKRFGAWYRFVPFYSFYPLKNQPKVVVLHVHCTIGTNSKFNYSVITKLQHQMRCVCTMDYVN